jgi:hypothetical protein
MSGDREIGRRRFIALTSAGGVAALLGSVALRRLSSALVGSDPPSRRLGTLFAHQESARAIGSRYLQAFPDEASGRSLVGRIARGLPGGEEAIRTSGDDDLRVLLARRSMQDFAEGRTVELDGWILARTEARLCALSSIL